MGKELLALGAPSVNHLEVWHGKARVRKVMERVSEGGTVVKEDKMKEGIGREEK